MKTRLMPRSRSCLAFVLALQCLMSGAHAADAAPVSEAEVRKMYEDFVSGTRGKQEAHVYHILFQTREDAEAALAEIKAGALFEDVAKARSRDPGSRPNGGDLGWVIEPYSMFDEEFAYQLRKLRAPGIYPQPFKTRFGWHLAQITATREYQVPQLEEMRSWIEKYLRDKQ